MSSGPELINDSSSIVDVHKHDIILTTRKKIVSDVAI